jgi:pyrimidine operon attenuation protein/uracil phosphoribosyltransferase
MQTLLDASQINQVMSALADDILADPAFQSQSQSPVLVGIRSRGEVIAQRLASALADRLKAGRTGAYNPDASSGEPGARAKAFPGIDVGALDITLYRDDLASRHAITIPQGTEMNFAIDDRPVILVDDVLETGRSVRAALDAIVDFGRPSSIRLAVLVDRGRRELPIAADYVGLLIPHAQPGQKVVVWLKPTDPDDGVFLQ